MSKNILKRVITFTLAAVMLAAFFCLASCSGGGLNGTYVEADSKIWINDSIEQVKFNGGKCSIKGAYISVDDMDYTIEDGVIKMTGKVSLLGMSNDISYKFSFRQEGRSIFFDDKEFVKK